MLNYCKEGPRIKVDSDFLSDSIGVSFSFNSESGFPAMKGVSSKHRIVLDPESIFEMNYSPEKTVHTNMYPPSSDDWLSHIIDTGFESILTIQNLIDTDRKLLTVTNKSSNELYYLGLIHSYEVNILSMKRDWNVYNEITLSEKPDDPIFEILGEESLDWSSLSKLVEGISIPNLVRYGIMGETLSQLVPKSFPDFVRKQIMAFLGWLDTAKIPSEDPVDFGMKYRSVEVFRTLVSGHLQCMVDGVPSPKYVRIMQMADRGQLEMPLRASVESFEQNPWILVRQKLHEMFPDWMGRVIESAQSLQNTGKIVTELPISREAAKLSKKAWSNRFAQMDRSLFMRGHIYKESIGLTPVLYIGSAHRWPHKHLEWSARLGYNTEKPRYIQIMVMPQTSIERVSRVIPTVHPIIWEMSSYNLHLYSDKEKSWKLKKSLILKSLESSRSLRQLKNEFGAWRNSHYLSLSQKQTRVLDLISWGIYLNSVETGHYASYYGINNSELEIELNSLLEKGVFLLQYFLIPEKLKSFCFIGEGPVHSICSLSRAFLKYAPSTQVRIYNDGNSCSIVSRIPEDEQIELLSTLTRASEETDIKLQVFPISAYVGYRNNLYSRLLKDDGTWDEDVSGLLGQVRLQPKISE
ncbi:MAG: hypothetical protein ACFFCT_14925 [Candidatus Odinarchaeota archaeon]